MSNEEFPNPSGDDEESKEKNNEELEATKKKLTDEEEREITESAATHVAERLLKNSVEWEEKVNKMTQLDRGEELSALGRSLTWVESELKEVEERIMDPHHERKRRINELHHQKTDYQMRIENLHRIRRKKGEE